MNLHQLLLILRARVWIVIATLVVGIAAALAVNLLMPREYTASSTVVIDSKVTDTVTGQQLPAPLMSTQIEIIRSHRVALEVVNATRLAESPVARQQFEQKTAGQGSLRDWWAERLLRNTEVKARRDSNLVDIQFTAQDPRFATLTANAFARAYMDISLMLNLEPARQTSTFFDEQLKTMRASLESAQGRLSSYQQEYGIVGSDQRIDVENSRLDELYSQLSAVEADARDSGTRERKAAEYAKRGRSPEEIPEVLANPIIQGIKSDLVRAESKFMEISAVLGANHPQVQRQRSEMDALRSKLDQEIRFAVAGMSTLSSIHSQRAADIRRAVTEQKDRMLHLKKQYDDIAVLKGEVDSAQKAYDIGLQRYTQTTLASRTNQTNVVVLNNAVEPTETSSPRIFRNLLVGLIAGLVVGLNLAFIFEVFDRRVRSGDDVQAELAIPVIGVLQNGRHRLPGRRRFLPGLPPGLLGGARA